MTLTVKNNNNNNEPLQAFKNNNKKIKSKHIKLSYKSRRENSVLTADLKTGSKTAGLIIKGSSFHND